jgi:hypothetical protein
MTPASVSMNRINFNKDRKLIKSGYKLCQQNGHSLWHSTLTFFSSSLICVGNLDPGKEVDGG